MSFINKILGKFRKDNQEVVVTRASKGVTRDYSYSFITPGFKTTEGTPSPENLDVLLSMFQKDPVINAALTTRVNAILASGWTFEGKASGVTRAKNRAEKVGLTYSFLRQLFLNALIYRHAFIELERNASGEVVNLFLLDAPQVEVQHDKHGTITGFVQEATNGETITWSVNDVIYVPFDKVSSKVWGELDLKTLYRTVTTKNLLEEFLNVLAQSNAWRQVFKTKMKDEEAEEFLAYYMASLSDPLMPLVMKVPKDADAVKDDVFQTLRNPAELKEFLGALEYFRTQALMLLKVPPIVVGLPDNSNRSNSDSQLKVFNLNNEAERLIVAEAFNKHLLPAIGVPDGVRFVWHPVDKRSEKDDVEIAEKLMNMGAKPEQIEKFLRATGLELPEGEFFNPQTTMLKTPDDAASRPSRAREDKGGEINNKGTGRDSSTRGDQL